MSKMPSRFSIVFKYEYLGENRFQNLSKNTFYKAKYEKGNWVITQHLNNNSKSIVRVITKFNNNGQIYYNGKLFLGPCVPKMKSYVDPSKFLNTFEYESKILRIFTGGIENIYPEDIKYYKENKLKTSFVGKTYSKTSVIGEVYADSKNSESQYIAGHKSVQETALSEVNWSADFSTNVIYATDGELRYALPKVMEIGKFFQNRMQKIKIQISEFRILHGNENITQKSCDISSTYNVVLEEIIHMN